MSANSWRASSVDTGTNLRLVMRDKRVNRNWYYDPDASEPVPEDLIERIKANLKAITLLRELETEGRLPSAGEAHALARYSGWSPMREFFQPKFLSSNPDRWEATYGPCFHELGQLASEQELSGLQKNWIGSQRTSPQACKALWRIAEHLGFQGGRVFEPGLGIGIIQGACPENLRERVAFTGVELEPIAARIAQKLFPDARVVNARLEEVLLENQCDLVIGFVPIGKRVKDEIIDVELDLHNYCFARGLHALKPGGIMVAVTSRRTMDFGMTQRRYLASISEFIGAIRVPREFVTLDDQAEALDIVMLRRPDGRKIFESPNWLLSREKKDIIAHDGFIAQDGPSDQSRRNEYFDDHQGMILGSEFLSGAFWSYAATPRLSYYQYAVKSDPDALKRELDKAVSSLPTGLCTSRSRRRIAPGQQNIRGAQTEDVPIGTYALGPAGQVLYREPSGLAVPQWAETERLTDTRLGLQSRLALARSYIGLRDQYLALLKAQQDPSLSAELVETRRQELSDLYDQHVVRWGELNRRGSPVLFLSDDLYFFSVLGLEEIRIEEENDEESIAISKGAVFNQRTVSAAPEITVSETVDDALIQSIGFKGLIDLPYMEMLLGRQSDSIVNELIQKDLVFINPANNRLETREDYLSGNVREKYNQSKKLVENGAERFTRNLTALEAVLPKDVPIEEIDAKFGAKWIEPSCVEEFLRRILKLEAQVSYNSRVDLWKIEIKSGKKSVENTSTYGTTDDPAHEIILKLLNQRSLNVYKSVEMPWGMTRIFDAVATADLETKAVQLQQLFIQFTRSTPAVSESISAAFNQRLNAHVPTTYHDGRHLRLPGFSNVFRRDDHQLRAVWRGLIEGCGAIAYETGLGKTLIQVMLARESKRLKRVNKPAIVAFNSTVSQFAETFRAAYPDAKVLVADSQNFNSRNRQKFLARAMHGDWDAVILSHSDFTSIPCSKRTVERYYDHFIEELQECIDDAEGADRSEEIRTYYWHIKQTRERKDKALERLADDHKGELYWEQLGVDMLLVDEVHEFKKMPFLTKMANVRGVDTSYSLRGMDLDMKRLDVQERNRNGRGVYGATGTPIDNTMAEIWNLVRLTAPHRLKEFSVETFDQFAASFCEQVTRIELNEANNRWVRRTRLAKFKHGKSFVRFVASAVDVYMPNAFSRQEINGKPKLATGRPIPVVIPLSEANRQVNELMKKI